MWINLETLSQVKEAGPKEPYRIGLHHTKCLEQTKP